MIALATMVAYKNEAKRQILMHKSKDDIIAEMYKACRKAFNSDEECKQFCERIYALALISLLIDSNAIATEDINASTTNISSNAMPMRRGGDEGEGRGDKQGTQHTATST